MEKRARSQVGAAFRPRASEWAAAPAAGPRSATGRRRGPPAVASFPGGTGVTPDQALSHMQRTSAAGKVSPPPEPGNTQGSDLTSLREPCLCPSARNDTGRGGRLRSPRAFPSHRCKLGRSGPQVEPQAPLSVGGPRERSFSSLSGRADGQSWPRWRELGQRPQPPAAPRYFPRCRV